MNINAENWLGENTATIGTGTIVLGGAIRGFARFNAAGDGQIYYVIQDGFMKETGLGTLTGNSLERTNVHATMDAQGNYSKQSSPISLTGNAQVFGIVNAKFMQDLYNNQDDAIQAATDAIAAQAAAEIARDEAKTAQTKAETAQTAAKASQDAAKISETNSLASKNAAAASETAAAGSATAAKASETASKTSETNAKSSENAAKASQTAAKNSETNSASSAAAAATSATNAKSSEDTAKNSQTAAASSQSAAAISAQSAGTAATTATNQANAASGSAQAASQSANAAKTSETNSAASALEAKGYADILAGSGAWLWKGGIPSGTNLNSMGPTSAFVGIWHYGSTGATIANGYPEDNAQGILEVFGGGQYGGTQRFTCRDGNVYTRSLTASWNATTMPWGPWYIAGFRANSTYVTDCDLMQTAGAFPCRAATTNKPSGITQGGWLFVTDHIAGGNILQIYHTATTAAGQQDRRYTRTFNGTVWSPWKLLGTDAVTDLGFGSLNVPLSSFNWQQADFPTGSLQFAQFSSMTNVPSNMTYSDTTTLTIETVQSRGNLSVVKVTPLTTSAGNKREYTVVVSGTKGARTLQATQVWNDDSSTVIPVANGGTGKATAAEAAVAILNGDVLPSAAQLGGNLTIKKVYATAPANGQTVGSNVLKIASYLAAIESSSASFSIVKNQGGANSIARLTVFNKGAGGTGGVEASKDFDFSTDGNFTVPGTVKAGGLTASSGLNVSAGGAYVGGDLNVRGAVDFRDGAVKITNNLIIDSITAGTSTIKFTDPGGSIILNSNVDQTGSGPRRIMRFASPEHFIFLEVAGGFRCRSGTDAIGSNPDNGFNFNWIANHGMDLWVDSSNIGVLSTTPNCDKFLKKDIAYKNDSAAVLEEVKQWKVASFKYKARGVISESGTKLGFIAQDLVEVSPDVVMGEGLKDENYDPNNPIGAYSLDQVALIAKLTQAVQALAAEVEALKASK